MDFLCLAGGARRSMTAQCHVFLSGLPCAFECRRWWAVWKLCRFPLLLLPKVLQKILFSILFWFLFKMWHTLAEYPRLASNSVFLPLPLKCWVYWCVGLHGMLCTLSWDSISEVSLRSCCTTSGTLPGVGGGSQSSREQTVPLLWSSVALHFKRKRWLQL